MNFEISEDQQLLCDSLQRLLDQHCGFGQRREISETAAGWSAQLWARFADLGVLSLGIPERFGGLGGGAADRLPALQAMGRALSLEPILACGVLAPTAVLAAGTEAQKDTLLPAMARGELRMAWAHEDAECADDAADLHQRPVRAVSEGDQWRLHGGKPLVLHGSDADRLIVSARIGEGADAHRALFLVDPKADGLALRSYRLVDDTACAELTLRGVLAQGLGDPLDAQGQGMALRRALDAGTAAACALMVGAMETAFTLTTSYLNARKQFGRLLGEYQALRHRVAEMSVGLEMSRSMAIAAAVAAQVEPSAASAAELARAKLVIGRHARSLCHAAIQSHGGIGMTQEYAVGHCLRRVHVLDQLFGDVDVQTAQLAAMAA